jgi:thiol-disulfide isomerase/thioredoxin
VSVENISAKQIEHIQLEFLFTNTVPGGPLLRIPLNYGKVPGLEQPASYSMSSLNAGDAVTLTLAPKAGLIRRMLSGASFRRDAVNIRLARVIQGSIMLYKNILRHGWAVLMVACFLTPPEIRAQTHRRLVEKDTRLLPVPAPIEIVEIVVAGQRTTAGQPFPADGNWLRGITLKVRNISELPVRYVEFQVEAVPSEAGKPRLRLPLKYGRMPTGIPNPSGALTPDTEAKSGEYFQLSLSTDLYDSVVKSQSRDGGKMNFEKARINMSLVVFEGGRAWRNGHMSRRDSINPQRWNVTDEDLNYIKPVTTPSDVGGRAPNFLVRDLSGRSFDLAAMRGKVVVLNFWFIGCMPCRAEIPELNKLVKDYNGEDVMFIAIAPDGEAELRTFLKDVAFTFHVVPNGGDVLGRYGLAGFPRHVVIDRGGL